MSWVNWNSPRLKWFLVAAVLLVALTFGLTSGSLLRYPDEHEYHELATSLVHGLGYVTPELEPNIYRPPGYPAFLAVVYLLDTKPILAKLANSCVLAACGLIVYLLVCRTSRRGAILALVLIALYPLFPYAASTLFPQILGATLFLLVVLTVTINHRTLGTAFIAGVLYGTLVLTVPAFLLLLPVFVVFLITTGAEVPLRRVFLSAVMVLGFSMVVAPWSLRNWWVFDRFVLVSANGGENLLVGNCENARPNSGVNTDISRYRAMAENLDPVDRDRFFRDQAITWIRENPWQASWLYLLKALNYFNFRNELWTASEESTLKQVVVFVSYYPLLLIALLRCGFFRRVPFTAAERLLYTLYFGNALISALFFTRLRFRIPFDFLLIAIVASFLGQMLTLGMRGGAVGDLETEIAPDQVDRNGGVG